MNPITHARVRLEGELRKQMRGQIKEWWGKLTDDDMDLTAGNAEQIVGLLQQRSMVIQRARRRGIQPADKGGS